MRSSRELRWLHRMLQGATRCHGCVPRPQPGSDLRFAPEHVQPGRAPQRSGVAGVYRTSGFRGLINAYKAYKAQSETVLSKSEINLRDSAKPAPETITIENKSSKRKTYTFSHRGAALMNAAPNVHTAEYYEKW